MPRFLLTFAVVFFAVGAAFSQDRSALDDLWKIKDARSKRISSTNPKDPDNHDNVRVKPGETFVLADVCGSGVIRHIWLTFAESGPSWLSKDGAAAADEVVIRCYWDGAKEPAVEAPLGDFFAQGFGRRVEVRSTPVQVQGGDAYNAFWTMPFFNAAKITVTNESSKPLAAFYYSIDYTEEKLPADAAYFCAQYRREFPTKTGGDYLILDAVGEGHYIGTVMSVRTRSPEWFGEGDEKFSIDGEARPSSRGTGTEDYFLNAWGLEKSSWPNFGVTILDGEWGEVGAKFSAYRWHLEAPVRFKKSLRVEIEHYGWMSADETASGKVEGFVEREDDFATVAFWYQRGEPKRFAPLPALADRRWPNLDRIIEGKELLAHSSAQGGTLSLQKGSPWTGEGQVFFDAEKEGAQFELSFEIAEAAKKRVYLPLTSSYDFGRYTITLDEKEIAKDRDFYAPEVDLRELSLGDLELAPGRHTLRFVCTGRNPASKGVKLGVDSLRFRERWQKKR